MHSLPGVVLVEYVIFLPFCRWTGGETVTEKKLSTKSNKYLVCSGKCLSVWVKKNVCQFWSI